MTNEQREKLIETMAYQVMEGMDYKSMEIYVVEQLSDYFKSLDDSELAIEAVNYFDAPIEDII